MKRRILALFLAVVMVVGMIPTSAFAAELDGTRSEEEGTEPTVQETLIDEEFQEEGEPAEETEEEVPEEAEQITEETEAPTEEETVPEETAEEMAAETTEETVEETIEETEEEWFSSPIITTLEELKAMALGEYDSYLLAADLTLPADWEPMDFDGVFDGNGFVIYLNGQPLFGHLSGSAVVSNVILDGSVKAECAGSLAVTSSGTIRNSVSMAQVVSTADWTDNGGFVYSLQNGSISNCVFLGTLADDEDTAAYGIAASNEGGDISDCYWLDAEEAVWSEGDTADNGRQISLEETVTASFLEELNTGLGEDDLPWGLDEDGQPVPGGEEPGLEQEFAAFGLDEMEPERQLITVMLDESAPYSSPFDPDASVVVTVEGHTLSHGFYIEPTVVSFDEFVNYWAGRGVTVAKEDITAGGMIDYVLYTNGYSHESQTEPTVSGPGYLGGINGIRAGKGDAKVPACLADDGITIEQVEGDDLYEFDYTSGGGWMFTEGNWLSNQAMGSHKFSQFGTLHTVNGQNYYVVRLQFTIAGLGADLGFVDWGSSYGYVAADKSDLYIEYATLGADAAAKQEALAVMAQLDATQEEVDAAAQALWDSVHAEEPAFIVNLDQEPVTYEFGMEADPLVVEAAVSEGQLSYAWYSSTDMVNWTELDCTDSTYIPSTDRAGTVYYKCIVTNDDGTGMVSVAESNVATVICGVQTPVFTSNLSTDEVFYLTTDTAAPLAVEASVTDAGTVTYQWYLSDDKESWIAIDGAVGSEYLPSVTVTGTTYYKCTATNSMDDSESSADSAVAKVTVRVDTPAFDTDLRTTTYYVQLDESYTLSVEASIRDGGELSYQWYSGNGSFGGIESMNPIDGATEASYTVTDTDQPGHTYYCVKVTNTLGTEIAEAVSNWSAVNVKVCEPSFDTDLPRAEQVYKLNDKNAVPMEVDAVLEDWYLEGELRGTITYQWYVGEERYGTYEMIPGATGNRFIPDLTAAGYRYYKCEATNTVENSKGEAFTATDTSGTATVRVIGCEIPDITADLPSRMEYTLDQADAQPLSVEVAPVSDGGTLSYQWYRFEGDGYGVTVDRMTLIEGATQPGYQPALSTGGLVQYACRVTNTLGDQKTCTDSEVCKVTVNCAFPEITKDLEAKTFTYIEGDESATLSVEATSPDGGELSYQWFNGSNAVEGATENSFTIPTNEPGSYSYSVEVTNTKAGATRSVKSAVVTVKVTAIQKEISTEEELRNMRPNGSYILMNDIELTQKWNPINNFSGILDGNGHTISKISVPEGAGFFTSTQTGAEIRNLGLNGRISRAGSGDIGGLIGKVDGDTVISGCHVDLAVVGEQTNNAGGIVGNASGTCLIENSYYTGVLRGQASSWAYSGGIIGNKTNGVTIKNCYTTNDKLVGNYGWFGVDTSTLINNYSALGDNYTSPIPEDLSQFHELLGDAYIEDSANINRGYPILLWQQISADKTALLAAIAQAEALTQEDYTEQSWAALASALEEACLVADASDSAQEAVDEALENLNTAIEALRENDERAIRAILDAVSEKMTNSGSDWDVTDMAAYGMLDKMDLDAMKANAEQYVFGQSPNSTNYERIAISGTAAGIHAGRYPRADGTTTDLIAEIANMENLGTINGYIYALNAYDSGNYNLPEGAKWTRDAVIEYILQKQLADGGWALFGSVSDPDITGMAVTALSLYRDRGDVSAALDRALTWMSESQLPNGGYKGAGLWGVENSNSSSMIIIALAAMNIDADKDERFIKNGNSVLDALLAYRTEENWIGYKGPVYDGSGAMATEQGFRALVAYTNWQAGDGPYYIYDFADSLADVLVSFRLVGDEKHEKNPHGDYMTWIPTEELEVSRDSKVFDVFASVLAENGMDFEETQPGYIGRIQAPEALGGYWLEEFDSGVNSGWMYTVNGIHPDIGLRECAVQDRDEIIWHYTDNFGADDGSWLTVPDTAPEKPEAVASVEALIDAIGTPVTLDSRDAIEAARKAFDELTAGQQWMVVNRENLESAEEAFKKLLKPDNSEALRGAYKDTYDYLKTKTPDTGVVGGEWLVLGLARSEFGNLSEAYKDAYYNKAVQFVRSKINAQEQLDKSASTDNSRMILALTAIGKDPRDVDGHNLLNGLKEMGYLKKQGLNGPIWALIAFDSHNYETPNGMTRDALITEILNAQLPEGGWNRSAGVRVLDVDITGMALYALAPYTGRAEVKAAVDKALDRLSQAQNVSGGFSYGGSSETLESCAQVMTALSALGIDADTDERFVKDGNSVVSALLDFYQGGGRFRHVAGGAENQMSNEQALYAMAAYFRNQNKEDSLFDMSDVELEAGGSGEDGGDTSEPDGKEELRSAIAKAEALKESDYTPKSWAVVKAALTAAKSVLSNDNATEKQIADATRKLNDAVTALVKASSGSNGSSGSSGGSTSNKTGTTTTTSRSKLQAEVKKAEQLKKEDYTDQSWKPFEEALAEAKKVLDNSKATQKQINDAYGKLVKAEKALEKADGASIEDSRKKLEAEIKAAEQLAVDEYSAKSWKIFADVLSDAKKVLESEDSTQKQLDTAYMKLVAAKKGLKKAADNRLKLEDLVEKCGSLVKSDYTAESWAAFEEALSNAKAVLENKNADQQQIDDALTALNAAGRALVPAETDASGISLTWLILLVILLTASVCGAIGFAVLKRKKK